MEGFVFVMSGCKLSGFRGDFGRILDTAVVVANGCWGVSLGTVRIVRQMDVVCFLDLDQFHFQLINGVIFGLEFPFHL